MAPTKAPTSLYENYKKDTKTFLWWLVNTFNHLVKSRELGSKETKPISADRGPSVNELVPMATLITQQEETVPGSILHLLHSAIKARSAVTTAYESVSESDTDEALTRSNNRHRHFTNTLQNCFHTLGGQNWLNNKREETVPSDEDIDQILNKFQTLAIETLAPSSEEDEPPSPKHKGKGKPKKGKGKKGKAKKGKSKPAHKKDSAKDDTFQQIPLESMRIIDGEDDLVTDYLLATYSAVQQWIELRDFIQRKWEEVAYKGHHSAAAAATSKVAFSMVRKTHAAIFVDFPGNDSYLNIVKTLARGEVENARGNFVLSTTSNGQATTRTVSDIKEEFLYNTFTDLKDFIVDYRLNRTGRPAKRTKTFLRAWDPDQDLSILSDQERLEWRRRYTIRWLYDLVNVTSAPKLQTARAQNTPYEDVDWSPDNTRTIFGLQEFAAEITAMAMQKPNSEVDNRIQPHHVFQLQCIVDSFAVSKGWYVSGPGGHCTKDPGDFQATRDVELFLDPDRTTETGGYCLSLDAMDTQIHRCCEDANALHSITQYMLGTKDEFSQLLGEHIYSKGEDHYKDIEGSQFRDYNTNGLQVYSPFLCGAGLEEALSLSHKQMMWMWQEMREPVMLMHMYVFLRRKGYLKEDVPLWEALVILFKKGVFPGQENQAVVSSTGDALRTLLGSHQTRSGTRQVYTGNDIHELFDMENCRHFNRESSLTIHRKVEWDWRVAKTRDHSSDEDLAALREAGAKYFDGNEMGNVPGGTALPAGTRTTGGTESQSLSGNASAGESSRQTAPLGASQTTGAPPSPPEMTEHELLSLLDADFLDDVYGFSTHHPARPLSGINYPYITVLILNIFYQVERELEEIGNHLYQYHFGNPRAHNVSSRGSMFLVAMQESDAPSVECLEIMADFLAGENHRMWECTYWDARRR